MSDPVALEQRLRRLEATLEALSARERIAAASGGSGLIAPRIVYVGTSGVLTTEAGFEYIEADNELRAGRLRTAEQVTPTTPASGFGDFFFSTVNLPSGVGDDGIVRQMVRHVENTGFTPAFTGSGTAGTFTYSAQRGHYTRIENLCFLRIYLEVTAVSVAPTVDLNITGLPFTSATGANGGLSGLSVGYINNFNLSANCVQLTAYVEANSTLIRLMEVFDNATTTRFPASSFQACGIIVSGFYQIA